MPMNTGFRQVGTVFDFVEFVLTVTPVPFSEWYPSKGRNRTFLFWSVLILICYYHKMLMNKGISRIGTVFDFGVSTDCIACLRLDWYPYKGRKRT